jgi:hypothetical protein
LGKAGRGSGLTLNGGRNEGLGARRGAVSLGADGAAGGAAGGDSTATLVVGFGSGSGAGGGAGSDVADSTD